MSDQPTASTAPSAAPSAADKNKAQAEVDKATTAARTEVQEAPQKTSGSTEYRTAQSDPPSASLDTEEGNSDWDPAKFTPPTLEEMPKEGPGSPGFDVYAPENAKWLNPQDDETADSNDDDVKTALERETADGAGETPVAQLPESDVDPNEELADDYPDLEPRGDDLTDEKKDNA